MPVAMRYRDIRKVDWTDRIGQSLIQSAPIKTETQERSSVNFRIFLKSESQNYPSIPNNPFNPRQLTHYKPNSLIFHYRCIRFDSVTVLQGSSLPAQGESSVPRLSIIVPYRNNDARLELTLLSVLENRPQDCEIIVVHSGTYANPYELDDEVIFVEEERRANTAQLLNAGVMAACSPTVCILLDGAEVTADWNNAAIDQLLPSNMAAVAASVRYFNSKLPSCGIDTHLLRHIQSARSGRLETTRESDACAGPALACGLYRRKVLLAVGGWNVAVDESMVDVELAMTLKGIGLECRYEPDLNATMTCGSSTRKLSTSAMSQLSSLFVAHGAVSSSWFSTLRNFASDCLKGRLLTAAAWSAGVRDTNSIRKSQLRLNHAKQQLGGAAESSTLPIHNDLPTRARVARRAA